MHFQLLGNNHLVTNLQQDLRQFVISSTSVLSTVAKVNICLLTPLPDVILKFFDFTVTEANQSSVRGSEEAALESEDKQSVGLMT